MTHCQCFSQQSGRPRQTYSLTPGSAHNLRRTHSHTGRAAPSQPLRRGRTARTAHSSVSLPAAGEVSAPRPAPAGPSRSSLTADGIFLPGTVDLLTTAARSPRSPPGQGTAHTRIALSSPRCPGSLPSPAARPGPALPGGERAPGHLSSPAVMTPSSLGMRSAALTASWCPSTLLSRTGRRLCGREWISAAMARNAASSGAARRAELSRVAAQPHRAPMASRAGRAAAGRMPWNSRAAGAVFHRRAENSI